MTAMNYNYKTKIITHLILKYFQSCKHVGLLHSKVPYYVSIKVKKNMNLTSLLKYVYLLGDMFILSDYITKKTIFQVFGLKIHFGSHV